MSATAPSLGPHLVQVRNLTISYRRHPAVHHVSGEFLPATATAVLGPNGAGKSTLLKALAGVLRPESGQIVRPDPQQIGYLPQQAHMDRSLPVRVLDLVLLGLWRRWGWLGGASRQDLRRAEEALAQVGLVGFEERNIAGLSVGQFQRVLFARLLIQDAPVVLLDEPFNALDAQTTQDLLQLVASWPQQGRTVICVLHDYQQVITHFPQAVLLARQCVAWGRTEDVLTAHHLATARNMAEAWNETAGICTVPATSTPPYALPLEPP